MYNIILNSYFSEKCKKKQKKNLLQAEIADAVQSYAEEMQLKKVKSLAVYDPEKVAKVLYLLVQVTRRPG